jgi:hypothetical protein
VDYDDDDLAERKYMEARDNVSDAELVARMNEAPDMGGALLVELSTWVANRPASPNFHDTSFDLATK